MFHKGLFTSATLFGCAVVAMAHCAEANAASPKKAARAQAPSKLAYACEGVVAIATTNAAGVSARETTQLGFKVMVNFAKREATVLGVQGSVRIKAGRYTLMPAGRKLSFEIPWTDDNGLGQLMILSINEDGEFYSKVEIPMPSLGGYGALGELFGAMYSVTRYAEYSGMCFKAG